METPGTPVTLVRTIKASPEEVYAAWTDPVLFQRWMSLDDHAVTAELDPRVGGRYRFESKVGEDVHATSGEYRELVPGRKLVKTWVYAGPFKEFEHHETVLTVELRELEPNLTELTLTHSRTPNAKYGDSVRQGWTALLDHLATLAAEGRLVGARSEV
jgi:uncharacterized protein YndB with AHSA1/START domain